MAATPQNLAATFDSDPTVNHEAEIISIVAAFSCLSLVALTLRLLSRRLKRVGLDWDDYLVIASWVGVSLRPTRCQNSTDLKLGGNVGGRDPRCYL